MNRVRLQFSLSAMLILTTVIAVCLAFSANRARRKALVIRTYDAQKAAVDAAMNDFTRKLESDGFNVTNDSRRVGGSGDWRTYVALTARKVGKDRLRCYVEVQGFVSHNGSDDPTWMSNLPMTISRRGEALDHRFVAMLSADLKDRGWEYNVNDQCKGSWRVQ